MVRELLRHVRRRHVHRSCFAGGAASAGTRLRCTVLRMAGFLNAAPARFRHWSIAAFGVWNSAIWLARIRNILSDDSLDGGGKALWMVPALIFGGGGVLALVLWCKGRASLARPVAAVLLFAMLYWPVRTVFVFLNDHSAAFRIVHLVLAVVSVALAFGAARRFVRTNKVPRGAFR